MDKKNSGNVNSNSSFKKQFTVFFNNLSPELRASSRRVQFYGVLLLAKLVEGGFFQSDPLCSAKGVAAFKNALKLYNIGVAGVNESCVGETDLDGAGDDYRNHITYGTDLFDKTVQLPLLGEGDAFYWGVLRQILTEHHEKWDGSGYPSGKVGGEISLAARICAVASAFDTYTTSTSQRDRMTVEDAVEKISKRAERYFDPTVTQALENCVDAINKSIDDGVLARASAGRKSLRPIEQLYRAVYDYGNRLTFGYETDIRLNDKTLGVVESKVFIPVAEKSSKINELVRWSVENACENVVALNNKGRFTGNIFIPLSIKALVKKNFVQNISKIIKQHQLKCEDFCFVVSENMLAVNLEKASAAIDELRAAGFAVAVGGFGSEYANIAALQDLSVDYIMLGSDFVDKIVTDERSRKITEGVVELANKLDIMVIADGVATKEQAEVLFKMGCNLMRGKRFGRFTSPAEI